MTIDAAIVDYSAGLLLRYFRGGAQIDGEVPRLDQRRDVDILKGHWAMSAPVRALVGYLAARPHEAQALLTYRERVDDAVARGRIDARGGRGRRRALPRNNQISFADQGKPVPCATRRWSSGEVS